MANAPFSSSLQSVATAITDPSSDILISSQSIKSSVNSKLHINSKSVLYISQNLPFILTADLCEQFSHKRNYLFSHSICENIPFFQF